MAHDSELRKSIHKLAAGESKLLDSLGSAQIEQEVIMKVMPLVQQQLDNVKEETGIQLSLTEEDVRRYMDDVLSELTKV